MIEYYGWISVSDSTYESDDNKMRLILHELSLYLSKYEIENAHIHTVNGSYQLLVSGNTNHLSQDVIDIFKLYDYIANNVLMRGGRMRG